jgi:hypothetical protein
MSREALKTQVARELGTPAVVIDLDRVEANIAPPHRLVSHAAFLTISMNGDAEGTGPGIGPLSDRWCTLHA